MEVCKGVSPSQNPIGSWLSKRVTCKDEIKKNGNYKSYFLQQDLNFSKYEKIRAENLRKRKNSVEYSKIHKVPSCSYHSMQIYPKNISSSHPLTFYNQYLSVLVANPTNSKISGKKSQKADLGTSLILPPIAKGLLNYGKNREDIKKSQFSTEEEKESDVYIDDKKSPTNFKSIPSIYSSHISSFTPEKVLSSFQSSNNSYNKNQKTISSSTSSQPPQLIPSRISPEFGIRNSYSPSSSSTSTIIPVNTFYSKSVTTNSKPINEGDDAQLIVKSLIPKKNFKSLESSKDYPPVYSSILNSVPQTLPIRASYTRPHSAYQPPSHQVPHTRQILPSNSNNVVFLSSPPPFVKKPDYLNPIGGCETYFYSYKLSPQGNDCINCKPSSPHPSVRSSINHPPRSHSSDSSLPHHLVSTASTRASQIVSKRELCKWSENIVQRVLKGERVEMGILSHFREEYNLNFHK
jgi:hypothetical protein